MTNVYKRIIVLTGVVGISILSLNYHIGPAGTAGYSVTGASFGTFGSGVYCNNCHSGGSYNTSATTVQLLSGGVPVTGNYVPGWNYTLRINRATNASQASQPDPGFGFQVTCVVNSNNNDVNGWGTPPANTANIFTGNRHYIEHTDKLSNSITQVNIPWTAPTGNVGTVKFYLALNNVNGDGQPTFDHPAAFTAQFNQAPLPITWLYFRGKETGTANLLEWGVSYESENDFYVVERSEDGVNFKNLGQVKANHDPVAVHTYSLADASPAARTYYRIKSIDINGGEIFYKTIQIVRPVGISFTHFTNGNDVVLKVSSDHEKDLMVTIFGTDGRKISTQKISISIGENQVKLERPSQSGMFLLYVNDNEELVYRSKFYNSL